MSFAGVKAPEGRFDGITRAYTEQDVQRLRGSLHVEHTLAQVRTGGVVQLSSSASGNPLPTVGRTPLCSAGGC